MLLPLERCVTEVPGALCFVSARFGTTQRTCLLCTAFLSAGEAPALDLAASHCAPAAKPLLCCDNHASCGHSIPWSPG